MSPSPSRVEKLEKEIARLQEQLRAEKRKSESLWNDLYEHFLKEGNSEENSGWWADQISQIFSRWVVNQRTKLSERISESGELTMPPYTDCLNDLAMSLSPPGSEPPEWIPSLSDFEVTRQHSSKLPMVVPMDEAEALKPRKRTINVPKPIPGAVPLPLPPLTEEEKARDRAGR